MDKGTILVVDDDAFFRHQYGDILTEAGYHVTTAASAEEALEVLANENFDVMMTDMVLPGLSGIDLLREVKRRETPPEVILVTGHATVETAIRALKAGARDYLVKPFDPEVLLHDVHTCLEQRRLLNENLHLKRQIRLFTAGQDLAALLDMERLLSQAMISFLEETGGGRAFAFLKNGRNEIDIIGTEGVSEEIARAHALRLMELKPECKWFQRFSAEQLTPVVEPFVDIRSLYFFPLCREDHGQGAVVVFNPDAGDFPADVYEPNIRFLFEQLSLGFSNALRYEGARDMMFTDDLTGLYNYRFLQNSLDQEVRRCERYGATFSVVFIDLDHFKEV
ncbi:MAG: diguanylate cyclase response regulator, partial [Desulfuromonas sp.]